VFVREIPFPPKTVDELYATECRLAATAKDGASIDIVHAVSLLRTGDRGIKCHFGLPGEAAAATAVCRSLRP
jgi:hypothetical protein